jgi:photosystem II stability/assembly factor-like uncharacterized protein
MIRKTVCAAAASLLLLAAAAPDTDQPLWRATHGLLIGIARAGNRLVAVGDRGHVLLSDNNGTSWRLAKSPADELLTDVIFPMPAEGWAVGQDETILHSVDAGQSWTQVHFVPNADQNLFSIVSIAPGHLLASGAYNLMLETEDGKTWKDEKLADLDDDYHLNCAAARGDDVLITGESGHAFLRHAGAWAKIPVPYDGSQFGCLVGADGSLYSFGLRGSLFRQAPGAAAWSRIDTGGPRPIFGGVILPDGKLALVGGNGLALLFDPGSGKITTLHTGTDAALSGIVQAQDGKLVIVGDDGVHIVDPGSATGQDPGL